MSSVVESSSSSRRRSRDALRGLTLHAILLAEKSQAAAAEVNRTLLDVIRDEEPHCSLFNQSNKYRKPWKAFCDRLLSKRAVNTPAPHSIPINNDQDSFNVFRNSSYSSRSVDNGPNHNPQTSPRRSIRFGALVPIQLESPDQEASSAREGTRSLATALAEERALSASPVRMSLVELLEESDSVVNVATNYRPRPILPGGDDDDGTEREMEVRNPDIEEGSKNKSDSCCVCMVRSKGAALIPCGHTFCRICSRELWVQRGYCPLCNTCILEILYLF